MHSEWIQDLFQGEECLCVCGCELFWSWSGPGLQSCQDVCWIHAEMMFFMKYLMLFGVNVCSILCKLYQLFQLLFYSFVGVAQVSKASWINSGFTQFSACVWVFSWSVQGEFSTRSIVLIFKLKQLCWIWCPNMYHLLLLKETTSTHKSYWHIYCFNTSKIKTLTLQVQGSHHWPYVPSHVQWKERSQPIICSENMKLTTLFLLNLGLSQIYGNANMEIEAPQDTKLAIVEKQLSEQALVIENHNMVIEKQNIVIEKQTLAIEVLMQRVDSLQAAVNSIQVTLRFAGASCNHSFFVLCLLQTCFSITALLGFAATKQMFVMFVFHKLLFSESRAEWHIWLGDPSWRAWRWCCNTADWHHCAWR